MDAAEAVAARIRRLRVARVWGEVTAIRAGLVIVGGLGRRASIGDRVSLGDGALFGEIVALGADQAEVLPEGAADGLSVGAPAELLFAPAIAPSEAWVGRIVDPFGRPLDGRPLATGRTERGFQTPPRGGTGWAAGLRPALPCSTRCCRWSVASGSGCSPGRAWASPRCCPRSPAGSRPTWS